MKDPASALGAQQRGDHHVYPGQEIGIGQEVDGDDPVVGDGEAEHHARLAARCPDQAGRTVDERGRAALARPEKVAATACAPRTSGSAPERAAAASALSTTSGSSAANSAAKSPRRDAARNASTICRRARDIDCGDGGVELGDVAARGVGIRVGLGAGGGPGRGRALVGGHPLVRVLLGAARTRAPGAAGQLPRRRRGAADDRRDLLERHGEEVVQHERQPLGRRQRVQHHEQGRPDGIGEQRLPFRVGALADRRRPPRQTRRGAAERVLPAGRARASMSGTRGDHGGEPAAEVGTPLVSARVSRSQVSCTASSASAAEPRCARLPTAGGHGSPRIRSPTDRPSPQPFARSDPVAPCRAAGSVSRMTNQRRRCDTAVEAACRHGLPDGRRPARGVRGSPADRVVGSGCMPANPAGRRCCPPGTVRSVTPWDGFQLAAMNDADRRAPGR